MFIPHYVLRVTCHLSHVTCQMLFFLSWKKIGQIGGASRWRVCYQWGLPCLVLYWPWDHIRPSLVKFKITLKILLTSISAFWRLFLSSLEVSVIEHWKKIDSELDLLDRKYKLQCKSEKENRLRKQYLKKFHIFCHKTNMPYTFWKNAKEWGREKNPSSIVY